MLSLEAADASVWVAGIAAVGSIITARLSYQNKKNTAMGNGHSLARGVERIEDKLNEHENRLDRIEVRIVEDVADIKERLASAVFDKERHMVTYRHDRRYVDE